MTKQEFIAQLQRLTPDVDRRVYPISYHSALRITQESGVLKIRELNMNTGAWRCYEDASAANVSSISRVRSLTQFAIFFEDELIGTLYAGIFTSTPTSVSLEEI